MPPPCSPDHFDPQKARTVGKKYLYMHYRSSSTRDTNESMSDEIERLQNNALAKLTRRYGKALVRYMLNPNHSTNALVPPAVRVLTNRIRESNDPAELREYEKAAEQVQQGRIQPTELMRVLDGALRAPVLRAGPTSPGSTETASMGKDPTQAEITRLNILVDELVGENDELKQKIEDTRKEYEEVVIPKFNEMEATIKTQEDKIKAQKVEIQKLTNVREGTKKIIDALKKNLGECLKTGKDGENWKTAFENKTKEAVDALKLELDKCQQDLKDNGAAAQRQLEKVTGEKTTLEKQVGDLEESLRKQRTEVETTTAALGKEKTTLEKQVTELRASLLEQKQDCDSKIEEKGKELEKASKTGTETAKLRTELDALKITAKQCEEDKTELQTTNTAYESKKTEYEKQKGKLEEVLQTTQNSLSDKRKEANKLRKKVEELKERLKASGVVLNSLDEYAKVLLSEKEKELKDQYEKSVLDLTAKIARFVNDSKKVKEYKLKLKVEKERVIAEWEKLYTEVKKVVAEEAEERSKKDPSKAKEIAREQEETQRKLETNKKSNKTNFSKRVLGTRKREVGNTTSNKRPKPEGAKDTSLIGTELKKGNLEGVVKGKYNIQIGEDFYTGIENSTKAGGGYFKGYKNGDDTRYRKTVSIEPTAESPEKRIIKDPNATNPEPMNIVEENSFSLEGLVPALPVLRHPERHEMD